MSKSSNFSIQVRGTLILVDLTGDWSEQDDLSYLSALTEQIAHINREPWGLLVDMRGWRVQDAATEPTFKIALDRRNQKVECWIVDDLQQGDFLLPHFKNTSHKPSKFLNPTEAIKYIEKLGFSMPTNQILSKN